MKKFLSFFSLLVSLTLLLAACSGAADETEAPGQEITEEVEITAGLPETGAETTEEPPGTGAEATEDLPDTGAETAQPTLMESPPPAGPSTSPAEFLDPSLLTNLLDFDVRNAGGEELGEVENLTIDLGNAQVQYILIASGGFLDLGEKLIPVPWTVASVNPACVAAAQGSDTGVTTGAAAEGTQSPGEDTSGGVETAVPDLGAVGAEPMDCFFFLNVEDEILRQAPNFDLDGLPDIDTPGWDAEFLDYWSSIEIPGSGDPQAVEAEEPGQTGSGEIVLAEDLLAANVTDQQDETIAAVIDAIVNVGTGDLQYLVLTGDGAVYELGAEVIPVPPQALLPTEDDHFYILIVEADALVEAPGFGEENDLPSTSIEGWDTEIQEYWQGLVETTP